MRRSTPEPEPSNARCPGCGLHTLGLPEQAAFCPTCGRRLRAKPTVWSAARRCASLLRRRRPEPPALPAGPRAPVVVGYSNALWRLGWRYESGRGATRNVPEAMRCYTKSAGLGNVEAQARLELGRREPIQVLPLSGDHGPLDLTA
jgi:TPR repeat protein